MKEELLLLLMLSLYFMVLLLKHFSIMLRNVGGGGERHVSQIRYSLVVILELNGVSEVQYKDVMMIDDGKYQ